MQAKLQRSVKKKVSRPIFYNSVKRTPKACLIVGDPLWSKHIWDHDLLYQQLVGNEGLDPYDITPQKGSLQRTPPFLAKHPHCCVLRDLQALCILVQGAWG